MRFWSRKMTKVWSSNSLIMQAPLRALKSIQSTFSQTHFKSQKWHLTPPASSMLSQWWLLWSWCNPILSQTKRLWFWRRLRSGMREMWLSAFKILLFVNFRLFHWTAHSFTLTLLVYSRVARKCGLNASQWVTKFSALPRYSAPAGIHAVKKGPELGTASISIDAYECYFCVCRYSATIKEGIKVPCVFRMRGVDTELVTIVTSCCRGWNVRTSHPSSQGQLLKLAFKIPHL